MNKSELIEKVAGTAGLSKRQAADAVDSALAAIVTHVAKGGEVSLSGFGTFAAAKRAARTARNPRTGAQVKVPARHVPTFRAAKHFKEAF